MPTKNTAARTNFTLANDLLAFWDAPSAVRRYTVLDADYTRHFHAIPSILGDDNEDALSLTFDVEELTLRPGSIIGTYDAHLASLRR